MTRQPPPLLEAEDVHVPRGRRRVLEGITAAFHGGEWTAVVGPNGAGKSTLLAVLGGLLRPVAGSVRLGGRPIHDFSDRDRARRLTWFGQTATHDGDIAAREVVTLGRLPHFGLFGAPDAADDAAVAAALEETEARPFSDRRLGELSGGERQRVLLSRAFAADATVALYDEPTIHLDAPHQRRLIRTLLARARGGTAVVSVLHDLTLALAADRIIVMAAGRIAADGAPGEASVRDSLTAVFEHSFAIEPLNCAGRARWAAVPII
jgi:iron complex transport system ATP-binding protein